MGCVISFYDGLKPSRQGGTTMPDEQSKEWMEACRDLADSLPHELLQPARAVLADLAGTIQTSSRGESLRAANYLIACIDYAGMAREEDSHAC